MSRRFLHVAGRWFQHVRNGHWITVHQGYLKGCCQCGLMHRYHYRISPSGQFQYQAVRDDRMTAIVRKARAKAKAMAAVRTRSKRAV